LAYEKKRESYIKKQISKQKEMQKKKEQQNEVRQQLKIQHLNKSLTILKRHKSSESVKEANNRSLELKRIQNESKVKDNRNQSRILNTHKWETWHNKYNCVSAKSINENQLHSAAMESLKRIQNAFEKAQMDHERALFKKAQSNFVSTDQRKVVIRHDKDIANQTK
jgi:hypothetical protein